MPAQAPPVTNERDALRAYLIQQQDAFRAVAFGLTDDELGRTPTPSALSVGALLKHATHGQRTWLASVLAAPELPAKTQSDEEEYAERMAYITWSAEDTLEAALAEYDEVSAAVLAAVAEVDLDLAVPVPPAPWNPTDIDSWSVRWVWFHLLEELTRHAGHADIIREAVDGATMFELIAGREGWPATPWLTPWQRRA
ncbi:DinB family protein [Nocardioides alcanivorans]|uniref:DinB family protein n=1 Tax=Nocardioides alcanivorans TaxID=2897352 RepID=UPI001F29916A|nr:DinB family protein [Nocardioides alcanivorans]